MEKRTLHNDLGGRYEQQQSQQDKILRSTSGQSLVELTLIVPFMLLLVLESLRWDLSSVRT